MQINGTAELDDDEGEEEEEEGEEEEDDEDMRVRKGRGARNEREHPTGNDGENSDAADVTGQYQRRRGRMTIRTRRVLLLRGRKTC